VEFAVLVAKTATGYNAYSPDIWFISSTGKTVEAAVAGFKEALELHVRLMREEGGALLPEPTLTATTVSVDFDVA
jgi:predicted RNase H-like HicB family nuclease